MSKIRKVLVIGLDGLEPAVVEPMMRRGALPSLARLAAGGSYSRVRTTSPAQTPVAWSTFATGVNPGGHGIFDFLRRDPATYLPDLGLNRYEQKSAFLPPKVVNLRRGETVWDVLSSAGAPSAVIRCPCTYPPAPLKGRLLAGMGVPDIRGGLGTSTLYSTQRGIAVGEAEQLVELTGDGDEFATVVIGPRNPKTRADVTSAISLTVDRGAGRATITSDGQPRRLELEQGRWSDWLRLRFRSGLLQSTAGMVRFLLVGVRPDIVLYASPVNFDPSAPLFPISHPIEYGDELSRRLGLYYTTGMVEDHTGLSNERFDESAFLRQCDDVMRERERMLFHELERQREGLLFCLFDTPDRIQHMFWRFREPDHPANRRAPPGGDMSRVIEDHYAACDAMVGRVLAAADDATLVIVMSDHGFSSFQRGVHLNAWLMEHGYLRLKQGIVPGEQAGEFLRHVDWGNTRAYALGLGSVYLNVQGREAEGVVPPAEAEALANEICGGLTGLVDAERGAVAVRGARPRKALYRGPYAAESPDLLVNFSPGYRVSWTTALGGVPAGVFEDNVKKWGGDHIIDPALVPGVLFSSRALRAGPDGPALEDLAPTILAALAVPKGAAMEGASLLA